MIRCSAKPKHSDRARMKFRCPTCGEWVCGWCEGTISADEKANRLCDVCWARAVVDRADDMERMHR
jgi:predicted RNA-binding Zn-ribbon protein involved in translation (DUF1610 family)